MVILTRDPVARTIDGVICAPITGVVRGTGGEIPVGPSDGVPRESVINLDQMTNLRRSAFKGRITTLNERRMADVGRGIQRTFGYRLSDLD